MAINDRQQEAEQLAAKWNLTSVQVLDNIHFLVGSLEQITEEIQMRRKQFGISYLALAVWAMKTFAPLVVRLAGV